MSLLRRDRNGLVKVQHGFLRKTTGTGFLELPQTKEEVYVNRVGGIPPNTDHEIAKQLPSPPIQTKTNFKAIPKAQERRADPVGNGFKALKGINLPKKKLNNLRFEL
jgi:hypothetical protein